MKRVQGRLRRIKRRRSPGQTQRRIRRDAERVTQHAVYRTRATRPRIDAEQGRLTPREALKLWRRRRAAVRDGGVHPVQAFVAGFADWKGRRDGGS